MFGKPKGPKVSFAVIAYNREKYIRECMDSILQQNIEKEIICIDDCSTDNTYEILIEYQQKYPEVTVYRNETNKGTVITRYEGMRRCNGEYMLFIDADDKVIGSYSDLYNLANKSKTDILEFSAETDADNPDIYNMRRTDYVTKGNLLIPYSKGEISNTLVNKLNQIQIRFDPRSVNNLYYLNKDRSVMKLYLNIPKSGSYADMTWNEYLDYSRSEKDMDKKYSDYNLALNVSKNQIVHSIAESVSSGTVIKTGLREARKAENAMINKDNAISSRITTEADKLLHGKTDDGENKAINEPEAKPVEGCLPENKENSVPGLLSDTVPDIFKELIK